MLILFNWINEKVSAESVKIFLTAAVERFSNHMGMAKEVSCMSRNGQIDLFDL